MSVPRHELNPSLRSFMSNFTVLRTTMSLSLDLSRHIGLGHARDMQKLVTQSRTWWSGKYNAVLLWWYHETLHSRPCQLFLVVAIVVPGHVSKDEHKPSSQSAARDRAPAAMMSDYPVSTRITRPDPCLRDWNQYRRVRALFNVAGGGPPQKARRKEGTRKTCLGTAAKVLS